jgi:hypothetical protein
MNLSLDESQNPLPSIIKTRLARSTRVLQLFIDPASNTKTASSDPIAPQSRIISEG